MSRHRAAKLLKRADERAQKGRLDIYHELIAKEVSSLDSATLAATLLALAVGDDGPRWQREDSGRKERREVQVDSEGTFISASFEHGRERPARENRPERPRRARVVTMRAARFTASRWVTATRFCLAQLWVH